MVEIFKLLNGCSLSVELKSAQEMALKLSVFNDVHPWNAEHPMVVTELGMSTLVNFDKPFAK